MVRYRLFLDMLFKRGFAPFFAWNTQVESIKVVIVFWRNFPYNHEERIIMWKGNILND